MEEVAKNIHKSKGVLYYYFKNKEELFKEVLKQELNCIKMELSKVMMSKNDSLIMLKEYISIRLKLLSKTVNYHETLKADFFEKYYFVKDVRDDFTEFERMQLTMMLKKGKDEGYLNVIDIDSTVDVILMVVSGIEIPLFLQNKYAEYGDTIEELSEMIADSLSMRNK
jgi:AcrR family transcriptional regulator